MADPVLAYHFVGATLRDGRAVPRDGAWLVHDGAVKMCESGLHASRHPFDALQYAPGPILCLVECEDTVAEDNDKLVCRRRRILRRHDMMEYLRWFARSQALSVMHLWDAPDVVLEWLMTGDESLRAAAGDAAMAAARADARADAWAAAMAAAWAAAWAAAGAAAWAAAGDAAMAAARADAWDAARAAAWAAARADAWDAARAAARDEFKLLVTEAGL